MDLYTTSFCLPRRPALYDAAAAVELPDDDANNLAVAGAAQDSSSSGVAFQRTGQRSSSSSISYRTSGSVPELSAITSSSSDLQAGTTPALVPFHTYNNNRTTDASSSRSSGSQAATALPSAAQHSPKSSTFTRSARRSTSSITSLGQATSATTTASSSATGGSPKHSIGLASSNASTRGGGPSASTSITSVLTNSGGPAREVLQLESADHDALRDSSAARAAHELGRQMQALCLEAMKHFQCMATCSPLEDKRAWIFHLSGGYQQVMGARGHILRGSPYRRRSIVRVPRSEVLDARENIRTDVRRKVDEIAALTKAHLAIVGLVNGTLVASRLETERSLEMVITGSYEGVEQARVRLLVLLDEMTGLHSDVCEIDYKLHNVIAGRKRCVIQTIQEETGTNIYFPTSLSSVIETRDAALLSKQNLIFITGEFFGVQRARDMLFQVSLHKSKCIISRDIAMLPRKIDWLLSDHPEDVKQAMHDNGTFINFPVLGSQASLVSVYGDNRVGIERTIRSIMHMTCQFYVSQFWLLPLSFDVFVPPPSVNPAQVSAILNLVSSTTSAEAVFKSNCFEFHGLEAEIRAAVQLILGLDLIRAYHHEIRFQIELANEHRDFISGKKNGKLNKIMKSAGVKVKFETFNDYNFLIDIAGNDTGALQGLSLLQEELPAELSFHVPEVYHKRIIGVGGKNIQRIMKKFGVYVKFLNAEEFAAVGGYRDNEDNVIARTPAKNVASLEQLKQAIMEMVAPNDRDFIVEGVSVPRRYHRTLLGEKSIFLHDIESKTNSTIRFPPKESASDVVTIFGPESQLYGAAQMLLDHVPFEAEFRLPHSEEMSQLVLSQEFLDLQDRIKREFNITVLPAIDRSGEQEETVVHFMLSRSCQHFVASARDAVEDFLLAHSIPLHPASTHVRSDSFAASLPFFNSKILPTQASGLPSAGFSTPPNGGEEQRSVRPAASSPEIQALFASNRSHAVPYGAIPPHDGRGTFGSTRAQQASDRKQTSQHTSPLSQTRIALPPGSLLDGQLPHLSVSQSLWNAVPDPFAAAPTTNSSSHPAGFSAGGETSPTTTMTTTTVGAVKRESDPILDDRIRTDLARRGVIGHHLNARAQSLDIGRQSDSLRRTPASTTRVSDDLTSSFTHLRL